MQMLCLCSWRFTELGIVQAESETDSVAYILNNLDDNYFTTCRYSWSIEISLPCRLVIHLIVEKNTMRFWHYDKIGDVTRLFAFKPPNFCVSIVEIFYFWNSEIFRFFLENFWNNLVERQQPSYGIVKMWQGLILHQIPIIFFLKSFSGTTIHYVSLAIKLGMHYLNKKKTFHNLKYFCFYLCYL